MSAMVIRLVSWRPELTQSGRVPSSISTISRPSLSVSSVALNVKLRAVWPEMNVTDAGTPEKSPVRAPAPGLSVSGMTTSRSGSRSRVNVTEVLVPSARVTLPRTKVTRTGTVSTATSWSTRAAAAFPPSSWIGIAPGV